MSEMTERVAKAIIETMFAEHELPLEDEIYQKYLVTTRTAIGAMREPTEAMLNAARDWSAKKYGKPNGYDAAIGCWQAMIDAATGRA